MRATLQRGDERRGDSGTREREGRDQGEDQPVPAPKPPEPWPLLLKPPAGSKMSRARSTPRRRRVRRRTGRGRDRRPSARLRQRPGDDDQHRGEDAREEDAEQERCAASHAFGRSALLEMPVAVEQMSRNEAMNSNTAAPITTPSPRVRERMFTSGSFVSRPVVGRRRRCRMAVGPVKGGSRRAGWSPSYGGHYRPRGGGVSPAIRRRVRALPVAGNSRCPSAIPCAAFCRHAPLVSSAASFASRMLPHSMNTFGTVERLRPPRSLRTSSPVPPPM